VGDHVTTASDVTVPSQRLLASVSGDMLRNADSRAMNVADVTHRPEAEVNVCRMSSGSSHSSDVFIDDVADDVTSDDGVNSTQLTHETAGELFYLIRKMCINEFLLSITK